MGNVWYHAIIMVDVSRKDSVVWSRFYLTLGVILFLQIGQEWLRSLYFDSRLGVWSPPFDRVYVRFLLREIIVYANVCMGYLQFKRMGVAAQIPSLFAVCCVVLDGLFILSGGLRLLLPTNTFLLAKYGESFGYINSGILFVFCFGLHFILKETQKERE